VEAALQAFRGLVEGVRALHEHAPAIVHRDIKPDNIFVRTPDFVAGQEAPELVLGDAGIAFFDTTPDDTRLTDTYENVGSRDWMPPWLAGQRSDVAPSADLFSLGKVLWWMLSGRNLLPFWYHRRSSYDLEQLFPQLIGMQRVNQLLDALVVENEADMSIGSAANLVARIDEELEILQKRLPPPNVCRSCGLGSYGSVAPGTVGISQSSADLDAQVCDRCGHVQIFNTRNRRV